MRSASFLLIFAGLLWPVISRGNIPADLKPVGLGLGGFTYWSSSPFANAMLSAQDWIEFESGQWGSRTYYEGNPQFDANGYPKYLNTGKRLRTLMWPFSAGYGSSEPDFFPDRGQSGIGKWVLTWEGDADLRLQGGTFIDSESNGPSTGRIVDGRRVYIFDAGDRPGHLTVEEVNASDPVTDIKAWMPDPADPLNQTLEGQFWHPSILGYIADMDPNHLRFMDWNHTNASPQQDWSDRRPPSFRHQTGVLNRRSPAEGIVFYTNSSGDPVYFAGDRTTGIAFEHMVALCNATGRDMWICVPHLATDDFVEKLAQLILHGSDGENPYASPQGNPVHPPLDPSLNVWVEYSNEIWSNGNSFPQGNWAQAQADALGISKAQFNARRFSQVWSIFQDVLGGPERLVCVAAIWTASSSYTPPFMAELAAYAPTLSPAVWPDVISPTTYFGNGIQDWAYEQANLTRGTADQWFHTSEDFVYNTTTGATRPVSVPPEDPYWTSDKLQQDLQATFVEWKKRIFSGSTLEGGGPDATGTGGGFSSTLYDDIFATFGSHIPIASYEGGPSLYTDYHNGGDSRDDGITTFCNILNRQPEFAGIYTIQLNMARSKGLDSHGLFVDTGAWGKYGQWGHLEYPDQPPAESVKWTAVKDWAADTQSVNPIASVIGTRPAFDTPGTLPKAGYNIPYSQDIVVSGGESPAGPVFTVIGSLMAPGLQLEPVAGDPWRLRLSGAPQQGGWSYLYLRAQDDDGDAAWQLYSLYTTGGPGTLLEADITGSFTGAADLPWSATFSLDSRISWSGLDIGAPYSSGGGTATGTDGTGVRLYSETDALRFSVSQGGATQEDSTLASAIADDEFWSFTITPLPGESVNLRKAAFRLDWIRYTYHAPRDFAVFSSIEGFAQGSEFYDLESFSGEGKPMQSVFTLPDSALYENVTAPVEFRIYFHGSQYAHQAGILGLKLTGNLLPGTYAHWAASVDWRGRSPDPAADANLNGLANLFAYLMDLDPAGPNDPDLYPKYHYTGAVHSLVFRRNPRALDGALTLQSSPSLSAWTDVPVDGITLSESILDADPDGDGSAVKFQWLLQPAANPEFIRLKAE